MTIDELTKEPYLSYLQLYKEMYNNFKFYRGFVSPNGIKRAQIYRAIDLSCEGDISIKDFMFFNTNDGMIIKYRDIVNIEAFTVSFNHYMSQGTDYVFVPKTCDKLDQYNYSYYRRMLNNFLSNERIFGKALRMNENDNILLFASLETPNNKLLEKQWGEYLQGGVHRKYTFPSSKLLEVLKIFPWSSREKFEILDDDYIEITVKSSSIHDFENKLLKISEKDPYPMKCIELKSIINDEHEAFGILKILNKEIDDVSEIVPLPGTSKIYIPEDLTDNIEKILDNYEFSESLPEGTEIFTQDEFIGMSKYRRASLIKASSGNFYSFLDLYRNPKRNDPHTRVPFTEKFINEIVNIMNSVVGIFLTGFPPMNYKPELITVMSNSDAVIKTISFHIKLGEEVHPFWIIPDLRNSEFAGVTFDAIRILVIKWTDNSLFKGTFIHDDIHLLFSPIALYVFEQTSTNLNMYPRDIESQARYLKEQNDLLCRCN
jgi:hypothetical protein